MLEVLGAANSMEMVKILGTANGMEMDGGGVDQENCHTTTNPSPGLCHPPATHITKLTSTHQRSIGN